MFFSQRKRSVDGTHHHVSSRHLPRYPAEFDCRFSSRKLTDSARLRDLMSRTEGRRISYWPPDSRGFRTSRPDWSETPEGHLSLLRELGY
jgi:hypothetical protein